VVLADTTSIWSKVEFAKGTTPNGLVEQAVPDENTAPAGISETDWRIPSSTSPLLLGDVEALSSASIWLRRRVEPGSLIARNEKVVIRIIADPPPPTAPPITCPAGQHYDTTTQQCEDDEEPPDPECPQGQHLENGICVDNTGTPCPDGQHLENGQCVPDGSPPPQNQVRVVIVGDIGCNDSADTVLDTVSSSTDMNLFIANGDISYSSTIDCFMDLLEGYSEIVDIKSLTKISIGNHDDEEDGSAGLRRDFIEAFGIPSVGYYSFNIQNIHFLIMDTQSGYGNGSAQHTFVKNDLLQASQSASIDWIVVCYHKPTYTIPTDHAGLSDFRNVYHPLFDLYKVDLVVSGHNHNMQRTHPIKFNASSPSNPTIVSTGTSSGEVVSIYNNPDGRIFAICGSGGRARDSLGSMPSYFRFGNDDNYGVLDLLWFNNNKSMQGLFVRATHTPEEEVEILDSFRVNKT
jgi:predicted phosphodiesterase